MREKGGYGVFPMWDGVVELLQMPPHRGRIGQAQGMLLDLFGHGRHKPVPARELP